jgi:proteasome accessory factor B
VGTAVATGPTQAFDIPTDIDAASMVASATPQDRLVARVQIDPGSAVSLRRRASSISDDVAEISYADEDAFASELVGYADAVVVLSPESLRHTVIDLLRKITVTQVSA